MVSYVHPEGALPERRGPFPEAVQEPRHSRVIPAGIEAQRPVGLRQESPLLGAGTLRVPCGLLVLVDGVDGGVGVGEVRVGRLLALGRVGEGGLRVRRGEVGRLEVGGRGVAERRSRGVGRLVERGELREAAAGRRAGQAVRAVLGGSGRVGVRSLN